MAERIESIRVLPLRKQGSDGRIVVERSGNLPPWLHTQWVFPSPLSLRSVRVVASAYPVALFFHADGATGAAGTVAVADARPVRVGAGLNRIELLGLEFAVKDADGNPVDETVSRVEIVADVPVLAGNSFEGRSGGGAGRTLRGMRFSWPEPAQVGAVGVVATVFPVVLALRAGGTEEVVWTSTVTQNGVYGVPLDVAGAQDWELDAYPEAAAGADALDVDAPGPEILRVWAQRRMERPATREYFWRRPDGGGGAWLWERLAFEQDRGLASARVRASAYPVTMALYADGATTPTQSVVVRNGDQEEYVGLDAARTLDVRFVDADGDRADHLVDQVDLWMRQVHAVGPTNPASVFPALGRWRCHSFRFSEGGAPAVLVVRASDYRGLAARFYADGSASAAFTLRPKDGTAVRINAAPQRAEQWRLDLEVPAGTEIDGVHVYWWGRAQVGAGPLRIVRHAGEVAPWWWTEYAFPGEVELGSVRIEADAPTAVYAVGTATALAYGRGEMPFATAATGTVFRFDAPETVRGLTVFPVEHLVVGNRGLIVPSGALQSWRNKRIAFKESGRFVAARVVARRYPVLLTLGSMAAVSVADGEEVLLEKAAEAREWTLDVDPAELVDEVYLLGPSVKQWIQSGARWVREEEPWSWLGLVARGAGPFAPSRWRCPAKVYPVRAKLRKDGVWVQDLVVGDAGWQVLPKLGVAREWGLDVEAGEDAGIEEVGMR